MKRATALMLRSAASTWQARVDKLTSAERVAMAYELRQLALTAAELQAYLVSRGPAALGHKRALHATNRIGRLVWVALFGYDTYNPYVF